jgi:hypothetical protein
MELFRSGFNFLQFWVDYRLRLLWTSATHHRPGPSFDTICCVHHHLVFGVPIAVLGGGGMLLWHQSGWFYS